MCLLHRLAVRTGPRHVFSIRTAHSLSLEQVSIEQIFTNSTSIKRGVNNKYTVFIIVRLGAAEKKCNFFCVCYIIKKKKNCTFYSIKLFGSQIY